MADVPIHRKIDKILGPLLDTPPLYLQKVFTYEDEYKTTTQQLMDEVMK